MSDPASPPIECSYGFSAKFAARKAQERRRSHRTLALSLTLHGLVAVVVYYLTPWQDLLDEATAKQPVATRMLSTDDAKRLDARIELINTQKMQLQVSQLREIQQRIEMIEQQSRTTYEGYHQAQQAKALPQAIEIAGQAIEAMQRAEVALNQGDASAAREQQARAEQMQHEALGKLTMLPNGAASEAVAAQEQAAEAQVAASARAAAPTEVPDHQAIHGRSQRLQARIQHEKQVVRHLLTVIEHEQNNTRRYQSSIAKQDRELADEKLAQHHRNIRENQKKTEQHLAESQARIHETQEEIAEHRAIAETITAELEAGLAGIEAAQEEAASRNAAAAKLQQQALAAQQQVLQKIEATASEPSRPTQGDNSYAVKNPPKVASAAADTPDLDDKRIAKLYEDAEAVEQTLTNSFENIRAMELAVIRETSLHQASNSVDDVTPVRDGIDRDALAIDAKTGHDLANKREAVAQALRETQAMIDLALLLEAQLVQESAGEGAGRLALALANAEAQATSQPQTGDGAPADDAARLASSGNQRTAASISTAAGRRVAGAGDAADWLVIDSWYIIGPWDNTARRSLMRQFPPESIVDLDAVYLGKRGDLINWQFVKTMHHQGLTQPQNAEPYGVWYATTEVHFDEPKTLPVAVGSDDRGTFWVNDQLVWSSTPEHKVWNPNEAVVPIAFRAGRNQLLFRCENGQSVMGFSVSIGLGP